MSCKNCGNCCERVAFTESERDLVKKIARKMNLLWKKLEYKRSKHQIDIFYLPYADFKQISHLTDDYQSLIDSAYIRCPFLQNHSDGTTFCACYEDRPEVCRGFGTLGHIREDLLCENFCR